MDKCPKCGNKLSSVDVLCPRCGSLVEVVQIKKTSGVQSASGAIEPVKKVQQQNLVVYNDDLPPDDIFDDAEPEPEATVVPEPAVIPEPVIVPEPTIPIPEAIPLNYNEPKISEMLPGESEVGSEEDYLAWLKNMNLPALDDINESGGGEAYGDAKPLDDIVAPIATQPEETAASVSPAEVPRRWLEIEELTESSVFEPQQEAQAEPISSPPPVTPAVVIPPEERRYHADGGKTRRPAPRRGAGRVILMVFIWLVITGALFCGFYFFDQYVTGHYGSYQSMFYDLSGGQIDLGAPTDTPPALPSSQ